MIPSVGLDDLAGAIAKKIVTHLNDNKKWVSDDDQLSLKDEGDIEAIVQRYLAGFIGGHASNLLSKGADAIRSYFTKKGD